MNPIAYQNKDITQKLSAEILKNKSLAVYGLPHIHIKDLLPTNLPAVEANELRLDNLFILEDDSLALIDYESSFSGKDIIKYVNYIARILKRYTKDNRLNMPKLHLIIIFSADISHVDPVALDIGCMKLCMEPAFLTDIPSEKIFRKIQKKIYLKESLTEEELLQMVILPLTVPGNTGKKEMIKNVVNLAGQLADDTQRIHSLAGILTFSDKIIDAEDANRIKEMIRMNKVTRLIFEEGMAQGRTELLREQILKKMATGKSAEEIVDALEESPQNIQSIIDEIKQQIK